MKRINDKYVSLRELSIDQAIDSLQPDIKQDLLEQFHQSAASTITTILKLQRRKYTKETILTSPTIRALLRQFALQNLPELKHQVLPLESYVESLPKKQQQVWQKYSQMVKKGYNELSECQTA